MEHAAKEHWDVIVIGAGSAGMAAAIYAARFNLKTLVIGQVVGGLLNESHNVENYPGYKSIPGLDLMMKFKEHCDNLQIPFAETWVSGIAAHHYDNPKKTFYEIHAQDALGAVSSYRCRTLILTMGAKHRILGARGEKELAG